MQEGHQCSEAGRVSFAGESRSARVPSGCVCMRAGADNEVVHAQVATEEEGGEEAKVVEVAEEHLVSAPQHTDAPAHEDTAPAKATIPAKSNASCGCCIVQ